MKKPIFFVLFFKRNVLPVLK